MSNSRRLSRGDKRRNRRLVRLREVVRRDHAVLALDLASEKQVFVLTDHDSRVLARRTFRCRPRELGKAIEWGKAQAVKAGFAGVTLSCEPTGHRWKVVAELAAAAGVAMVCVQPMLVARAREAEDFTRDKSDEKDSLLIARLTTQLHVYLPEQPDPVWARLRHLGVRRVDQITERGAARQQMRDMLECAWPTALGAAAKPLDSMTWRAAMSVAQCDPDKITQYGTGKRGLERFTRQVRRELPRWGASRPNRRILTALFAAAHDAHAVPCEQDGSLERAWFALTDFHRAIAEVNQVEDLMTLIVEDLGYTLLIKTIPGLSIVGAAAILAESGDLNRYDSPRALVKHAGLCPRENSSGTFTGKTTISGRGRPLLRLAAWRAACSVILHNEVFAARHHHLTTRSTNKLTDTQARVAVAGSLLRQFHTVLTTHTPWDPTIANGATRTTHKEATHTA